MRPKFLLFALLILASAMAQGQRQFRVLHALGSGRDGAGLWDSVAFDTQGNLYGTTSGGGAHNGGTVYELRQRSDGRWSETILHSFLSSPNDGAGPLGGVLFDSSGNLYGTTEGGGGPYTYGTVYSLSAGRNGWREKVLHRFGRKDKAGSPWGNLVMDQGRNLYGAAFSAFELSPGPKGWIEAILHTFNGDNGDGLGAAAGPIRDAAGNLYGTTVYGGGGPLCVDGCGTVYELQPPQAEDLAGGRAWKERILHRFGFSDTDGVWPGLGQLAMDSQGNLYGTANGGKYRSGVVFKLTHVPTATDQVWQETILYNFTGGADGAVSEGVILDSAGNLFGTAAVGGSPNCGRGVVFKLSPRAHGSWKYTLLHTFIGSDGAEPDANLTLGPDGKLYGTTPVGGAHGGVVVFEITP